jgi:hypothetical protein
MPAIVTLISKLSMAAFGQIAFRSATAKENEMADDPRFAAAKQLFQRIEDSIARSPKPVKIVGFVITKAIAHPQGIKNGARRQWDLVQVRNFRQRLLCRAPMDRSCKNLRTSPSPQGKKMERKMSAAKRLGFGEAAKSKTMSGNAPSHSDENAVADIPSIILVTAAEWYFNALANKLKLIATLNATSTTRGHEAILELMHSKAKISSVPIKQIKQKVRALAAGAKHARTATLESMKTNAIAEHEKNAVVTALARLTLSTSLALNHIFDHHFTDAKTTRTGTIESSSVNSELITNGNPQIALSAARLSISAAIPSLEANRRNELLSMLNASSELPCDEATRKLSPILHEISTAKGCEASVRKNATYLKRWLTEGSAELGARERAMFGQNGIRTKERKCNER